MENLPGIKDFLKIKYMFKNVHDITKEFEKKICDYTNSPYCICVDNASNALFLALYYEFHIKPGHYGNGKDVWIPCHTYPSVPAEIIHAGGKVNFDKYLKSYPFLSGAYVLGGTNVWDSALRFTHRMYKRHTHMCLSFTGPYKHLKLGKGGAILTDDEAAYKWFKKARFSGRDECSYHTDNFDDNPVIGWNFYMMPEIAARGLLLMTQFYNMDGSPKYNDDLELPYPDLSKFKIYKQ